MRRKIVKRVPMCKIEERLARIERRLDIIINTLAPRRDSVDDAIDRLNEAAHALREQSKKDRELLKDKWGL